MSLCEEFLSNKTYLIQFLRASLVPKVDEQSVALSNIESHIKKDWPTFRSAQPDKPTSILLAVGWQAVQMAVEKSPDLCALIWYGSANLLLDESTIDPLAKLVIDFVQSQGSEMERRAIEEWNAYSAKVAKQVKSVALIEVKNGLQQPLFKASSATDPTNSTAIDGGNPHQLSNDGNWGLFFAKSASAAITNVLATVAKAILESVQASFDDLNKKVSLVSSELTRSHAAQSKRTELLWLSESLYSIRLGKGYRDLNSTDTIVALAADMAEIATGLSPQSVEYFLSENVERLLPNTEIRMEIFVREVAQSSLRTQYPIAIFEPIEGTTRIGVLEMAGSVAAGKGDLKQIPVKTGFAKSRMMLASNLAKWIYREIKCAECLNKELWS